MKRYAIDERDGFPRCDKNGLSAAGIPLVWAF